MGSKVSWIHPVRGIQVLLGIAVFGLIIYILSAYQFDNVIKFMLFNGIWTGFVAAPYLALAPVHFPRIASYFVMPLVEISTFVLWLVGVILLGIQLPSSKDCNSSGCEATLATVVLSAIECALFLATAINSIVSGVQKHQRHIERRQNLRNQPAPEVEASGAIESV